MAQSAELKSDRIQVRIDEVTKNKIERAAHYEHQTLSEFVVIKAAAAADEILGEKEKVTLSEADWSVFFEALTNPSPPNKALKAAFRRYQKRPR